MIQKRPRSPQATFLPSSSLPLLSRKTCLSVQSLSLSSSLDLKYPGHSALLHCPLAHTLRDGGYRGRLVQIEQKGASACHIFGDTSLSSGLRKRRWIVLKRPEQVCCQLFSHQDAGTLTPTPCLYLDQYWLWEDPSNAAASSWCLVKNPYRTQ